jgi:hypothetical protein
VAAEHPVLFAEHRAAASIPVVVAQGHNLVAVVVMQDLREL